MNDKSSVNKKVSVEYRNFLIASICMMIAMLLCAVVYFADTNLLAIEDSTCRKFDSFIVRIKLLLLAFLTSIFLLIPMVYKNKPESRIYRFANFSQIVFSILIIPACMAYGALCGWL